MDHSSNLLNVITTNLATINNIYTEVEDLNCECFSWKHQEVLIGWAIKLLNSYLFLATEYAKSWRVQYLYREEQPTS